MGRNPSDNERSISDVHVVGALAGVCHRLIRIGAGPGPEGLPRARPHIILSDGAACPILELLPAVEVLAGLLLGIDAVEISRSSGRTARKDRQEEEGEDLHALSPRMLDRK